MYVSQLKKVMEFASSHLAEFHKQNGGLDSKGVVGAAVDPNPLWQPPPPSVGNLKINTNAAFFCDNNGRGRESVESVLHSSDEVVHDAAAVNKGCRPC